MDRSDESGDLDFEVGDGATAQDVFDWALGEGFDFGWVNPAEDGDLHVPLLPALNSGLNASIWRGPQRVGPGGLTAADHERITSPNAQQSFLREFAGHDDGAAILADLSGLSVEEVQSQAREDIGDCTTRWREILPVGQLWRTCH